MTLYSTALWRLVAQKAKRRDRSRCTVARLLGGDCRGLLHVHHIVPVSEGGAALALDNLATVCASHHPKWESLRRAIMRQRGEVMQIRCPHSHRSLEARLLCEARLRREAQRRLALSA